jgi:hypothetical protein
MRSEKVFEKSTLPKKLHERLGENLWLKRVDGEPSQIRAWFYYGSPEEQVEWTNALVNAYLRFDSNASVVRWASDANDPSKPRRSVEYVEVTGKVLYKGKPLPGGMVTFVTADGFASKGIIDEDGSYTIKTLVGDVKICVDNTMLARKGPAPKKGAGKSKEPAPEQPKGKYVPLPRKYSNPDTSGLSWTVKKGKQTHDIELKD